MTDTTYNGWTNYETWLVNLWNTNDEGADSYWRTTVDECLSEAETDDREFFSLKEKAAILLADRMKDEYEEGSACLDGVILHGVYKDLLNAALSSVNWREIAKHYLDDATVYCAGWNMPGYMPETAPAEFATEEAARDYLCEELSRLADNEETEEAAAEYLAAHDAINGGQNNVTAGQYVYWLQEV